MNRADFLRTMDANHDRIVELNKTKGADYAASDDAFDNFKRHAATLGLTPEQIWAVYAGKHWDAIMTYVREGKVASEPIEGRLLDLILYCHLLLAHVHEQAGEPSAARAL